MESNNNIELQHVTEEQALIAAAAEGSVEALEGIRNVAESHLRDELAVINNLLANSRTTVTYEGFRKAFILALTHEALPGYVKLDLIPKQQLLAARIAKAIDLATNIKMTNLSIQMRTEDAEKAEGNANEENSTNS